MILDSPRLRLIGADEELLTLELADRPALWKKLGARAPQSWPAPLNDEGSFKFSLDFATKNPGSPWGFYYFLLKERAGLIVAGNGGFKGPPDAAGAVELGYSIIPECQRRGLATEATAAMAVFAAKQPGVKVIRAETLPELTPSIRVLEKNGFALVAGGSEPGVIRFERAAA